MDASIDPHKTYNYSHDQLTKTIFEMELRNHQIDKHTVTGERELIESYLKDRIKEITERWRV